MVKTRSAHGLHVLLWLPCGIWIICFLSVCLFHNPSEFDDLPLSASKTDMATVVKVMQLPDSGLEIRDRMWLKITIANAVIGEKSCAGKMVFTIDQHWRFFCVAAAVNNARTSAPLCLLAAAFALFCIVVKQQRLCAEPRCKWGV